MKKSVYKVLFIATFIVFLIIGIQLLFTPTKELPKVKVAGLIIQFRDGVTEQESKTILKNCNLTTYKLDYAVENMPDKYYIVADKDKAAKIKYELRKENWIGLTPDVKKDNYYMISVSDRTIHDKNFIEFLNRHNLQLKKFFYCHVIFTDHSESRISREHANELKHELETNENIFTVFFESIES